MIGNVDWTVFHWLNGQAGQYAVLDRVGKVFANDFAAVIVVTLMLGWLLAAGSHLVRERGLPRDLLTVVLAVAVSVGLALLVNQLVGHLWFRARPYDAHPTAHLLVAPSGDPSFPSDHAAAGFAMALGAMITLPRTAALVFLEAVLLSVGRVFVGLHYPGDIVGGLVVGASAAAVALALVALTGGALDRFVVIVNGYADRLGWQLRVL